MEVYIAGGCSEHGRNCYYVQGTDEAYLVDCGIMQGELEDKPALCSRQIHEAQYLFLTHSHLDHTGALEWLYEQGFSGEVILSKETYRQLGQRVMKYRFLEDIAQSGEMHVLTKKLSLMWGRSGHCVGAVWYYFLFENVKLLFSGDYCENSIAYQCDKLRGTEADIVIMDCAYGLDQTTAYENGCLFKEKVYSLRNKGPVLLPVPKYGRGLDLLRVLANQEQKLFADELIRRQLDTFLGMEGWIKEECRQQLEKLLVYPVWKYEVSDVRAVVLVADPQLKQEKNQQLCEDMIKMGGSVILTGNCDHNSYAERLLVSKQALFCRWHVHQCFDDVEALKKKNHLKKILLSHSNDTYSGTKLDREYLIPRREDIIVI